MSERLRPTIFLSILILAILWTLGSCNRTPELIHILTDRKELASAIEIYDSAHEEVIITMRHVAAVDETLIESENPDLVIGTHLNATEITRNLKPVGRTLKGYDAIIGPLDSRSRPYLLPLSFELPLIMGLKSTMDRLPDSSTVRPEELRKAAAAMNSTDSEGRLTRLGFSPSWNPLFLTDLWFARNPQALDDGIEGIRIDRLQSVMEEAGTWILEDIGGSVPDAEFNTKYRYIPDERLILDGRILFARTDMETWTALPDSISREMDIRYFRGERSIPVSSIVSAAIPRGSGNTAAVDEFLGWLTDPETQTLLMERWERNGIVVFGYLGGLSSDPSVNHGVLLERYPEMAGMVPEAHYLEAPGTLPHRWLRIRDEVVAPWMATAAARESDLLGAGTAPEGTSLLETYRIWDLSSLAEVD